MSFSVQVSWDGAVVPGVGLTSALGSTVEVVSMYGLSPGSVYKVPGRPDTAPLTLRRTLDDDLTFDLWARGPHLKKQVELALTDADTAVTVAYRLHECWVSGYSVAVDTVDTVGTDARATESITLSMNAWERVTPPTLDLARQHASLTGMQVRRVALADLLTGSAADTQRRVEELVREAQSAGELLLFDEADALFGRRSVVQDAHDRYQPTELDVVVDRLATLGAAVYVATPTPP